MRIVSRDLIQTEKIAGDWVRDLGKLNSKRATVVLLYGDLGSGKTTFTQAVARALGIKSRITSPTFVLQKRYLIKDKKFSWNRLIHMDCYRLAGGHEVNRLGWEEIVSDPKNLILIEWPDMIGGAVPKLSEKIHFKFIDEKTRSLDFKPWPKAKKK